MTRDPEVKCYLPGVPRATYMPFPFQIVQTGSNDILMAYEYASASRVVKMGKAEPPPVDTWMGQSVGRWEGDTLVVDVTGFNDQSWFDRAGNFHSEALHVIERFTPVHPNLIDYQVDDRGSQGVHPSLEDPDAPVSTAGGERPAHGVQVRRVRRRDDVRAPAQEDRRREALRRRACEVAVVSATPSAAAVTILT